MLKNTVSLVTGGASGLGKSCVERFLQQGGKVVLCDLPTSNGAEVAQNFGNSVEYTAVDVTSEKDVEKAISLAKYKFGKLDHIVNCAGIGASLKTFDFKKNIPHKLEEFIRIIMVNTVGTFNVIRLGAGLIGQNQPNENGTRGVIINIASVAAYDGPKWNAAYSASKGAVVAMTLPIARDLASQGIRVCAIAPGLFDTPILSSFPAKIIEALIKTIPHPQRLGHPNELAMLVQSIIENPLLNGEVIRVDGALRIQL